MIKQLMHDPIFLAQKSAPADREDLQIARDLLETLIAHADECVGMAANMIGVKKCIIAFYHNGEYITMFNPEILGGTDEYETEEGCLSLLGGPRKVKRYETITVRYQTDRFRTRTGTFTGFSAQIIQHEVDHCNGILI